MLTHLSRLVLAFPVAVAGWLLMVPFIVIALPFWLFSLAIRFLPRAWEPRCVEWRAIIQFDPDFGWRPKANLDTYYEVRNDDVYRLITDADGWPGTLSIEMSDAVVFGDSYAFGFGVNPGSSFVDLNPDIKVKAVASPGFSMVHYLLLTKHMARRLTGKLVFWLIYLENDLNDNITPAMHEYRSPFLRRSRDADTWDIMTAHISRSPWTASSASKRNMMLLAKLCTPCELSERVYSGCAHLISEGQRTVRAAGAELVVMTAPTLNQMNGAGHELLRSFLNSNADFDPDYPDRMIGTICSGLGVPFVASKRVLEASDYKRFERYHWTESGHRKVAALVRQVHESYRSGRLHAAARSTSFVEAPR